MAAKKMYILDHKMFLGKSKEEVGTRAYVSLFAVEL